jgi:hypothetical protein
MGYINPDFIVPTVISNVVSIDTRKTTEVFQYGADKHKDKGFEKGIVPISKHFYACLRHLWKWYFRFGNDDETGVDHIHHAHCRILMIIHQMNEDMNDDRPPM